MREVLRLPKSEEKKGFETVGEKEKKKKDVFVGVGQSIPFFYPLRDIRLTLRNIRGLGIERGRKRKRRRER